jgi:phosphopantothenoylcysteine decarboxylase/phosphopantothenate--cysteine ligase
MSEASTKFVGPTTFEGLTGRPVIQSMWEPSRIMDHIELVKWADLILLVPATANTINRLASGLADDLIGSLYLANNNKRPYWIAPAMNTNMYLHPATQRSIKQLAEWGCYIFETEEGVLACGDHGPGRLLDPDTIFEKITAELGGGE